MSDDPLDAVVGTAQAARSFIEQMPIGMSANEGPDLVFTVANSTFRANYGSRSLIGRAAREAFPEADGQGLIEMMERVYQTGDPVRLEAVRAELDVDGSGRASERFLDLMILPSHGAEGRVTGVVCHTHDVTKRVRAQQQAEERARAAEQRYMDARQVVQTLQDALLPVELPVLPELDVAARYLIAAQDEAAGGDWFDAVVRPDGAVALVVGDVVGHGVAASAVMGQLRAVLHDRLLGEDSLEAALGSLDRFARSTEGAAYATVCVVSVRPHTGEAEYCTAGHPPPIVASRSGGSRFLETTGAGTLGSGRAFATRALTLGEDETLVLYSDGLVERPGRAVAESTVEILQVVADQVAGRGFPLGAGRRTQRLCQESLDILTRTTGYADDITVLAAARTAPHPLYAVRWTAEPASDRRAREGVGAWLRDFDVATGVLVAATHAVSELVANTVRHAYAGSRPGPVEVTAEVDAHGWLECSVTDQGRWRVPDADGDSRGLALVRGLVDELELAHDASGTCARFRLRLGREAQLLSHGSGGDLRRPGADRAFAVHARDDEITVHGPLDVSSAGELARALRQRLPVTGARLWLDLSEVTHLGSAAVRVLHEADPGQGTTLELVAPFGTVAQHVLDLVRLPYVASRS